MAEESHYVKADLEEYASLSALSEGVRPHSRPSREKIIKQSVDLESEVKSVRHGSYQGTMLFAFRAGGYVWLLKDSYGSCSHCDGLLAADHVTEYATSMYRNAYAFESANDAVRFLHEKDGDGSIYGRRKWGSFVDEGIEMIADIE